MQIKSIKIKSEQSIDLGRLTVLVGPNNVGKSQTLRDINSKMVGGRKERSTLVDEIIIEKPAKLDDVFRGLEILDHPRHLDHILVRGITSSLLSGEEIAIQYNSFEQQFNQHKDGTFLLGGIGKFRVAYLDASSRLAVASSTGAFNPHTSAPQHLLQGLFRSGKSLEERLREAFKKTFKMDIRLDYSGMTQLYLRVAKEFPDIPPDPREAYLVMKEYNQLDTQGDGFRSFVGVVLSLLLSEGRIVLLDEPDAFLHPAQSRQLGYWIANYAESGNSQIIIATHNSNFLNGILARDTTVDIYRLNRQNDTTSYQKISSESISKLTKSPLLSSQSILDSVFHKGVVVCEADSDRTIYQTVALRKFDNQTTLFVHAHSKQTVKNVVALLRDATIPVCAVVDMDILNSKDDFKTLVEALEPSRQFDDLLELRNNIAKIIEGKSEEKILSNLKNEISEFLQQLEVNGHQMQGARSALRRIYSGLSKWSEVKKIGLDAFDNTIREEVEDIIEKCKSVNLFIVPVGELESWINVGTRKKKKWIVLALDKLFRDECPSNLSDFIRDILVSLGELSVKD